MRCLALGLAFAVLYQPAASAQSPKQRTPRRQEVTPELERSAFRDPTARTLLQGARAARLSQDSALRSYDAKTYMRMSVGLGIRRLGRERLFLRSEQSARVLWGRESGAWVEPTGRRSAFPMGEAELDLVNATPIPYFPGREALWFPSSDMGVVKAEVDEDDLIHPLATGAEAYYTYATGDSLTIRLPDGSAVRLRELRIAARRPEWRAFVGSFWFDVARGNLVRAAYRMAADLDVWQTATEEQKREIRELEERARTDTGEAARRARKDAEEHRDELLPLKIMSGVFTPMRARISAITVEYGLHQGRFWLPKLSIGEGEMVAGFVRVPMKYEESYRYRSVNGDEIVPAIPKAGEMGITEDDTLLATSGSVTMNMGREGPRIVDTSAAARLAREDSLMRRWTRRADSLRRVADEKHPKGDTTLARSLRQRAAYYDARIRETNRRRDACARDSTYLMGTTSRYEGALRMAVRMPCDTSRLATSPDLPASIYDPGEEIFGTAERDELLKKLDFALQPGWAPQRPRFHTGLDMLRYNRIEGLSLGGSATWPLGAGYTAQGIARFGAVDRVPNGELSLSRSNGRATVRLGAFHRLAVANDDWGSPLSFGASLANLLYARDEGFYYRSWGAELAGTRDAPGGGPLAGARLGWRLFGERQRSAGADPNTQLSLGNLLGDARFGQNIDAAQVSALGFSGDLARSVGANPQRLRLDVRARGEGAFTDRTDSIGTSGYGRFVLDGTLSRLFGKRGVALTGAAGTSAGDLPLQRAFYVGSLQTVRGQFARPLGEGRVGDAFWLGRAEVGTGIAARLALFYDVGWAGPRTDFTRPGRPLSGAGIGASFLDGLFRVDVSRGIWPEKRWRTDLYIDARF